MHDLVIRGGTVVDGTGVRAADGRRRRRPTGASSTIGRDVGRRHAGARCRRAPGDARLGRHPQPLRRSGALGPAARDVGRARRHHRGHGQLRRRLRAGAARDRGVDDHAHGRASRTSRRPCSSKASAGSGESFPEYLDALDAAPHAIDVAAQVPHARAARLRHGRARHRPRRGPDRGRDRDSWAALAAEAIEAGAVGFTTSRSRNHMASDGRITPSFSAGDAELLGIAGGDRADRQGRLRDQRRHRRRRRRPRALRRMCEVERATGVDRAAAAAGAAGRHLPPGARGVRARPPPTASTLLGQAAARPTGLLHVVGAVGSTRWRVRDVPGGAPARPDRAGRGRTCRPRILAELPGDAGHDHDASRSRSSSATRRATTVLRRSRSPRARRGRVSR